MTRFLKNRSKSQGQAPGSLIFIGRQKMEESRMELFRYNKETFSEEPLSELPEWPSGAPDSITWINISGLHDTDIIEKTGALFNISALAMEDLMNTDQRPKLMEEEHQLTIFLKEIEFDPKRKHISTDQVTLVVGANYVITFQEESGDPFDPVRDRIRNNRGKIRTSGADYLAYALLDTLVDGYIQNIELLGSAIEELEEHIIKYPGKETLQQIYHYKKEVSYLRKSVRPVKEIMLSLLKNESGLIRKKTGIYLADLDDLVNQAVEAVEIYYNMTHDLLTIYHTNVGNRTNDVMKILTIFSSIFIPLTFLVGVYGTNFDYLPELHFRYGYFIMWGIMVIMVFGMLYFFRRKRWL